VMCYVAFPMLAVKFNIMYCSTPWSVYSFRHLHFSSYIVYFLMQKINNMAALTKLHDFWVKMSMVCRHAPRCMFSVNL